MANINPPPKAAMPGKSSIPVSGRVSALAVAFLVGAAVSPAAKVAVGSSAISSVGSAVGASVTSSVGAAVISSVGAAVGQTQVSESVQADFLHVFDVVSQVSPVEQFAFVTHV